MPTTKDGIATGAPTSYTPIADDLAFGIARVAYLGSTMGALGIVRLAAGVMLALAPPFGAFSSLMRPAAFHRLGTVAGGRSTGALAVTVVLGVEPAFSSPGLTMSWRCVARIMQHLRLRPNCLS
ncbi:MAG: hypothetical protein IPO97_11025 [Sphingomonadales bacterium]|nr:hypothetical protein [Sphingomonadales bacterium]